MTNWKWKYFARDELKCKGDGSLVINEDALNKLERMREILGAPIKINSAYRSPAHNKRIKGAPNSMHVQGRAFDICTKGQDKMRIFWAAKEAGFTGFGFYRTFLHVDTGSTRWWGKEKHKKQYKPYYPPTFMQAPKPIVQKGSVTAYNSAFFAKETEAPHKIEGVLLSDKQKIAAVTTTGVAATGGIATVIADPQIITSGLSFLQAVDWRVAIVVVLVVVGALLWIRKRR